MSRERIPYQAEQQWLTEPTRRDLAEEEIAADRADAAHDDYEKNIEADHP